MVAIATLLAIIALVGGGAFVASAVRGSEEENTKQAEEATKQKELELEGAREGVDLTDKPNGFFDFLGSGNLTSMLPIIMMLMMFNRPDTQQAPVTIIERDDDD